MATLIKKVFLLITLLALTVILIIILPDNTKYKLYSATVIDKIQIMKRTSSPKMIFVGASNVAFGLDSEMIEKELGLNVVNFGSAGPGLRYMLELIKPYINQEDIVVIMPEYGYFYEGNLGGGNLMGYFDVYPSGLKYLKSYKQYIMLLKSIPDFLRRKIIMQFMKLLGKTYNDPIYHRSAFNKYGDVVSHIGKKSKDISKHTLFNKRIAFNFNNDSISVLNKFEAYANNHGIRSIFLFPCIPDLHYRKNQEQLEFLYHKLKSDLEIPIFSSPKEYSFPIEYFFDTVYHLNSQGRKIRTEKIISDISNTISKKITAH